MLDILLSIPPNEDDVDVRFEVSAESDLDRKLAIILAPKVRTRGTKMKEVGLVKGSRSGPGLSGS
jgi:hypothetical protein